MINQLQSFLYFLMISMKTSSNLKRIIFCHFWEGQKDVILFQERELSHEFDV